MRIPSWTGSWGGAWSGFRAATTAPVVVAGPCVPSYSYIFDGPVDATNLSMTAQDASTGAYLPGTVTYDPATRKATFSASPTNLFVRGGKYLLTVSGAAASDGTPMVPARFPFTPSAAPGLRLAVGGMNRRTGRLTA
jgi:hypothetical protein